MNKMILRVFAISKLIAHKKANRRMETKYKNIEAIMK